MPQDHALASPLLRRWRILTLALMVVGYAGYYVCRSNLSVATPDIIEEFGSRGIDKEAIGAIASLGTLFYAFGKFMGGSLADFLGGRRMFLFGMFGAIVCTMVFGAGGLPLFTLAWVINRLVQSTGWAGMVKITSKWFSYSAYGAVMGIVSLSFLFGDFFSRLYLGQLMKWGLGWRGIFLAAAATLAVIYLVNLFLLKETPKAIGEQEPEASPDNLFGKEGLEDRQTGLKELLAPLLRNALFWVVCLLSLGFTLVRETFNTWTPQYLVEVYRMDKGDAAMQSSLFPLFGGISVLLAGFLSDRLGRGGRAAIILFGLLLSLPGLLALGYARFESLPWLPVALLGAVAFMLIGPYSFLAGAISLDFGGKRGSATACGWIDGVGYLGGVFAGKGVGVVAQRYGWETAFLGLTGVALLSCAAAALYWFLQVKRDRRLAPVRDDETAAYASLETLQKTGSHTHGSEL